MSTKEQEAEMETKINDLQDDLDTMEAAGKLSLAEYIKLSLLAIQAEALVKILRHLEQHNENNLHHQFPLAWK